VDPAAGGGDVALARAFDERLGRLIKVLETIGEPDSRQRLTTLLARKQLELIDISIATSTDIFGNAMPTRIDDGAAPLQGLRGTFSATFDGNGTRVSSSKWYSKVHNVGWKIRAQQGPNLKFRLPSGRWVSKPSVTIPRRQFAPTRASGLGPIWGPALSQVVDDYMREYLRGR
jgi:hypothetical protein